MKTKTPEQIYEQWRRISRNATTRKNINRAKSAVMTARRYWNNIYRANGVADRHTSTDTARINEIWTNAATPVSIYMK